MSIREQLKVALPKAIKDRKSDTVNIVRTILAAIDNAEAIDMTEVYRLQEASVGRTTEVPRKQLTEIEIRQIVQSEINERKSALINYMRLGQDEEAKRLRNGLEAIDHYLNH